MPYTTNTFFSLMRIILGIILSFSFWGCTQTPSEINHLPTPQKQTLEKEDIVEGHTVTRIVDGDTLWVNINEKEEKIRLVGINTPETEKELAPVECYADEAEDRLKEILSQKKVTLLRNKKGDDRDQFDRLLRYVFVDGADVGAQLIEEGYAFAFRRYPHDRMNFYIQQESQAKAKKKGMWNPENCSYW